MSNAFFRGLGPLLCAALTAGAPVRASHDESVGFETTPPRLAFVDGEVSFWRPGAEDWTPAHVNTALAAGDQLYTQEEANAELQVGPRAFLRVAGETQLTLHRLDADYLQLGVTAGIVSLDARSLSASHSIEFATPNAAFTVERSGYYRIEVDGDTSTFTSRRGGRASVVPLRGEPAVIAASEQLVVTGSETPELESYAAPELDAWDRWNYARTDDQLDSPSARYVPSSVYGAHDLDPHGDWRIVSGYGPVWVPYHVGIGWVPYSTGRWIFDPIYGWTWVDDSPWGWAPFHYGRWVYLSGVWGWCPGPIGVRPYYAPALVAFYGGGVSVGVRPHLGWVALGWGEPLVPWWGPAQFRQHAHWAGWGGPRVVNQVVVKGERPIRADQIEIHQNARVRKAIVGVDRDVFGRRSERDAAFRRMQVGGLEPLRGAPAATPDRSSWVPDARSARKPPSALGERPVVGTREPKIVPRGEPQGRSGSGVKGKAWKTGHSEGAHPAGSPARVVTPAYESARPRTLERAPFGRSSELERGPAPPAPRFETRGAPSPAPPRVEPHAVSGRPAPELRGKQDAPSLRGERAEPRALPGEPANRVYRSGRPLPWGGAPASVRPGSAPRDTAR